MEETKEEILELSYFQYKKVFEYIDCFRKNKPLSETMEKQPIKLYTAEHKDTLQFLFKLIELQSVKIKVKTTKLNLKCNEIILIYDISTEKFYKVKNIKEFYNFFKKEIFYTNSFLHNQIFVNIKKIPKEINVMIFLEDLFNTLNNNMVENLYKLFKTISDDTEEIKNINLKGNIRYYIEYFFNELIWAISVMNANCNYTKRDFWCFYYNGHYSHENFASFVEWLNSANKYIANSYCENIKFEKTSNNHNGENIAHQINNFIKLTNTLFMKRDNFFYLQDKYYHNKISTEEFVDAYKKLLNTTSLMKLFKEVIDNLVYNFYIEFNTPNGKVVLQNRPKKQEQ